MRFAYPDEVGLVLGLFGGAALWVRQGPQLALDKVFQSGNRQANAKDLTHHCARRERAVTGVEGDLHAEAAAGQLGVKGVEMLCDLEPALAQCLGCLGMTRYGEIGVQRDDGFNVMVNGQTADQAKGFSRTFRRVGDKLEVVVVACQADEESSRSNSERYSTQRTGYNSPDFRLPGQSVVGWRRSEQEDSWWIVIGGRIRLWPRSESWSAAR